MDLFAVFVLFVIDLFLFLAAQCAAVGSTLVMDLLVYFRLIAISACGFARGHLAAAQSIRGALLLIRLAVVNFVRLHGVAVMFFVGDLLAGAVLFAVHLLPLLIRQLATIGCPVVVHLLIDVRLRAIRARRFTRGHLAAAQSVGDALILVRLALVGLIAAARASVWSRIAA